MDKFKVMNGGSIEIDLEAAKRPTGKRPGKMLHARKQPDYSPRRTKQDVLLNFVDLGQYWNGASWQDISFVKSPGMSTVFDSASIDTLQLTDWDDFRTYVLGLIDDHGLDAFRPLSFSSAETYGLDLYIGANFSAFDSSKYYPVARAGSRKWIKDQETAITTNAKWTDSGLKVPKDTANFQIWSHNAFISPKSVNTQFKITSEANYAAAAAVFKFDRNSTIYLVPKLASEFGWSRTNVIGRYRILNALYTVMPRSFFLGRNFDWTSFSTGGVGTAFEYTGTLSMPAFSADLAAMLTLMKARAEARVFDIFTGTFVALSNFPLIESGEAHWDAGWTGAGANPGITPLAAGIATVYPGTLVAIIKKGSDLFYVWHDSASYQNSINRFNRGGT